MNDYKELVDALRCGAWSVYKVNSPAAMCETIYNAQIADAIEQLVKERDAAIADLKEYASCDYCKHSNAECKEYWNIGECGLHGLCGGEKFEWRGIK